MSSRGRLLLGTMFTVAGVAAWALLLWAFEPVAYGIVRADPNRVSHLRFDVYDSPYIAQVLVGKEMRWGSLLLAVGGLLLMSVGRHRAVWLPLGFGLVWVATDLVLDLSNVDNLRTVVVAAAAVGAAAATTATLVTRRPVTTPARTAHWPLLYSGLALVFSSASLSFAFDGISLLSSMRAPGALLAVLRLVVILISLFLLWSAMAASAQPHPSRRRRATRIVATGFTVVLLAAFIAIAEGPGGPFLGQSWTALIFAFSVPAPLLLTTSVIPTGLLPSGFRGLLRFTGLALAAIVIYLPLGWASPMPLEVGPQIFYTVPPPADADADRYLTFPFGVIVGLTLGLLAFVTARLLAARSRSDQSTSDGLPRAAGGWRPAIGALLAVLGIVAWAAIAAIVEPTIHAFRLAHQSNFSDKAMTSFVLLGKDIRWAAIVLAVGGLVLLARNRGRTRAVTAGTVGWVVADFALDWTSLSGWPVAAAAAVVVGAVFLALLWRGRPGIARGPGPLPFLYSAAAIAVASLVFFDASGWMADNVPVWTMGVAAGIAVLLVVAAVVNALAVAATTGLLRIADATVVAAAGGGAVVAHLRWRMSVTRYDRAAEFLAQRWLIPLAAATLILACGLLVGGTGRVLRTLVAVVGVAGLVVLVAPSTMIGAVGVGYYTQPALIPLTGERAFFDGYPMVPAGILYGITIGVLALLPRALSTPPSVPLPPAPPEPPKPEPEPAALVTRVAPGVPEVLEHPPAAVGRG